MRSNNSKNLNLNGGNIVNNNSNKSINKLFIKKPLNKFPLSNKKINNHKINNGRYINFEQNNKINDNNKALISINASSKSAKKLIINLNNNSKSNLIRNGIIAKTNKSSSKKYFIMEKTNNENNENKTQNNENNDNEYLIDKNNFDLNYNINNNNYINNNFIIKHRNTNIINYNIGEKIDYNYNNNNQNKLNPNVNDSIEKFENKLKNYYQYSPEIKSKKIAYTNNDKNPLKTPNKENGLLLKLTPIDIIDNNKDLVNIEMDYNKNKIGKANNLMEFVKNLNEYVPQYRMNNQIPNSYKRNKSKSKSICENDNYNNIQNQIYKNKIIPGEKNNNFFINKKINN